MPRVSKKTDPAAQFAANAEEAADFLRLLANEHRLMILCRLGETEEMGAGALVEASGLSQSALSQHLARLREDGLVETRRDGVSIYYRLTDDRVRVVVGALKKVFCP
ncbi:MAG: metalloregulator ArsR/SmtB family transcription factor [Pseudomonadota bacterium]